MLVPAPVAQTPDRSFNFSDRLGRFVLANEPVIFTDKHAVPLTFEGAPFQGGNVDASDFFTWQVPGVSPETRHRFARNTCNGCHTFSETGGAEFQIRPRFPFQESSLSGFLLGARCDRLLGRRDPPLQRARPARAHPARPRLPGGDAPAPTA